MTCTLSSQEYKKNQRFSIIQIIYILKYINIYMQENIE